MTKKAQATKTAQPDRRPEFIRGLAEYLVGDQAHRSIQLQMGHAEAKKWAALRNLTPLFGYPTVEEAEAKLTTWLMGQDR